MNASAIYSKSGKGVQEASGKTSHLSRSDRAVLSAIDGRATLADVAQKVGKTFDPAFERLIEALDKGGFIREVSPGAAGAAPKPGLGAKPAAKAAAPVDPASDLDFTTALSIPRGKAASPKQTATIPPPPPPPSADEKAKAERIAREQQEAFVKAREEAERKAAAERERVKAEAEAKMRAETEAKLRAEAEAKVKAEAESKAKAAAEAKVKAARDAAAKAAAAAKAKAEAEAKQAREEAERARKAAEEKARREQEELLRKLEEERKAREEAERRAQEEAKRLEEERRKLEEERKRIEEERTRREQEEQMAKARARAAEREPEPEISLPEIAPAPTPAPTPAKASGGGFSDSLLADLESFTNRDAEEQKQRDEALRKEREAAVALAREVEERRMREDAERREQDAKAQRKREDAERKAREEAELREREEREQERLREEEEKRKREAEEREKKAKEEEQLAAKSTRTAAFDAAQRAKRERDLMARSRRQQASAAKAQRRGWGKPIAVTLFLLLLIAVAVAHVMPIDTLEYERAASEALGRPVKVGSARLWLVTGLQVRLSDVDLGEGLKIAQVRAYPQYDAILGPRKAFSRIEIDNLKLDQEVVGPAVFTKLKGYNLSIGRIVAKNLELTGPLALPKGLEAEVVYGADGAMRAAVVRGPEGLVARLNVKGGAIDTDMSAASFTLPFAPEISLSKFSLKGMATPQGMQVSEWDGALLNGTLSGTANVRWGESWIVDGAVTARNINAAVFAPALLSDGRAEGSGKFSMRGQPGKLASSSRLDGSFTVTRGVLGSIDLSRAIQTGGKTATGRTQFNEMNGQATYDRGAVSLRNVTIGAGQLNAGASADIAQNGALSGRIVADVRVASQTLRATLNLGGTVKEPQVKN